MKKNLFSIIFPIIYFSLAYWVKLYTGDGKFNFLEDVWQIIGVYIAVLIIGSLISLLFFSRFNFNEASKFGLIGLAVFILSPILLTIF